MDGSFHSSNMCVPFGIPMEVLKLLSCHGVGFSREGRNGQLLERGERELWNRAKSGRNVGNREKKESGRDK